MAGTQHRGRCPDVKRTTTSADAAVCDGQSGNVLANASDGIRSGQMQEGGNGHVADSGSHERRADGTAVTRTETVRADASWGMTLTSAAPDGRVDRGGRSAEHDIDNIWRPEPNRSGPGTLDGAKMPVSSDGSSPGGWATAGPWGERQDGRGVPRAGACSGGAEHHMPAVGGGPGQQQPVESDVRVKHRLSAASGMAGAGSGKPLPRLGLPGTVMGPSDPHGYGGVSTGPSDAAVRPVNYVGFASVPGQVHPSDTMMGDSAGDRTYQGVPVYGLPSIGRACLDSHESLKGYAKRILPRVEEAVAHVFASKVRLHGAVPYLVQSIGASFMDERMLIASLCIFDEKARLLLWCCVLFGMLTTSAGVVKEFASACNVVGPLLRSIVVSLMCALRSVGTPVPTLGPAATDNSCLAYETCRETEAFQYRSGEGRVSAFVTDDSRWRNLLVMEYTYLADVLCGMDSNAYAASLGKEVGEHWSTFLLCLRVPPSEPALSQFPAIVNDWYVLSPLSMICDIPARVGRATMMLEKCRIIRGVLGELAMCVVKTPWSRDVTMTAQVCDNILSLLRTCRGEVGSSQRVDHAEWASILRESAIEGMSMAELRAAVSVSAEGARGGRGTTKATLVPAVASAPAKHGSDGRKGRTKPKPLLDPTVVSLPGFLVAMYLKICASLCESTSEGHGRRGSTMGSTGSASTGSSVSGKKGKDGGGNKAGGRRGSKGRGSASSAQGGRRSSQTSQGSGLERHQEIDDGCGRQVEPLTNMVDKLLYESPDLKEAVLNRALLDVLRTGDTPFVDGDQSIGVRAIDHWIFVIHCVGVWGTRIPGEVTRYVVQGLLSCVESLVASAKVSFIRPMSLLLRRMLEADVPPGDLDHPMLYELLVSREARRSTAAADGPMFVLERISARGA